MRRRALFPAIHNVLSSPPSCGQRPRYDKIRLTLACGNYDRTRGLLEGSVQPEGIDLNYLPLPPGEIFWRMLNNEEFDASEMSLSTEGSRPTLEAFLRYLDVQGLTRRPVSIEELFVSNIRPEFLHYLRGTGEA